MTTQRGQVLAFFGLVMPIVLLPIVAYAIDAAALGTRAAGLQAAAAQAAEAAAQQVDAVALRASGTLEIDPSAARMVAQDALQAEEPAAVLRQVSVASTGVTVVATEDVDLPFPWFESKAILQARVTAQLVPGYDSPSSRLPLPSNTF